MEAPAPPHPPHDVSRVSLARCIPYLHTSPTSITHIHHPHPSPTSITHLNGYIMWGVWGRWRLHTRRSTPDLARIHPYNSGCRIATIHRRRFPRGTVPILHAGRGRGIPYSHRGHRFVPTASTEFGEIACLGVVYFENLVVELVDSQIQKCCNASPCDSNT